MARTLLPREHGAYVQLLAPLLAALIAAGGNLPAGLLATAAVLAFAANEPLLVALGHRGKRAREQDGPRARRLLAVLAPAAAAAGLAGLVLADRDTRLVAAAVAVPAAIVVVLAWKKLERSVAGELVAATALAGAAAPVAVAAGMPVRDAALVWAAWAIGYAATVVAVHRVITRHKRGPSRADLVARLGVVAVTAGLLALAWQWRHALVALPLAAGSAAVLLVAPPATRLRAIGFSLAGASLMSIALVVALD